MTKALVGRSHLPFWYNGHVDRLLKSASMNEKAVEPDIDQPSYIGTVYNKSRRVLFPSNPQEGRYGTPQLLAENLGAIGFEMVIKRPSDF